MVWPMQFSKAPAKVIPMFAAKSESRIFLLSDLIRRRSVSSSFIQASRATALASSSGSDEDSGVLRIPRLGNGFFQAVALRIARIPMPAGPCQLVASKIALSHRVGKGRFGEAE